MKVNRIVFCKDKYKTEEEFWSAINTAIRLLLDAEYITVVRYDEKELGIVVIEYNYADKSYGCPYPVWEQEE